jgi:hypothetical protein
LVVTGFVISYTLRINKKEPGFRSCEGRAPPPPLPQFYFTCHILLSIYSLRTVRSRDSQGRVQWQGLVLWMLTLSRTGFICDVIITMQKPTSALDGGEWSASRPDHFTPQRKSPSYPLDRRLGEPQSRPGRSENYPCV